MTEWSRGSVADGSRTPPSGLLSLALLGRLSLSVDGREVAIPGRKSRALLAYLALSEAAEESRERLVGLLWSESSEEHARASLRQAVREIREAIAPTGFEGLKIGKLGIALDRPQIRVDVSEVVEDAEAGRPNPRLLQTSRLPESLVKGFSSLDPAFRIWLLARRQTLHDRLVRALESHLRTNPPGSLLGEELANAILNLDPTHEEACRFLMRARRDRGDLAGALGLYKRLWDLLEAEYDIEPSPQTQELIVEIRNTPAQRAEPVPEAGPPTVGGALSPAPRPAEATRPPRRVLISMGAFGAAGITPERTYLVDGFRRELIACLVRFREWQVRQSAQTSPAGLPEGSVMQEYAVEGSAFENDNAVQLIVTLRDARSGVFIWADRYHLTLENWFEAREAIVRRIALSLNVHLSAARLTLLSRQPDAALEVYDRWLRGEVLVNNYNAADWRRATDLMQGMIKEKPDFAPAYASLVRLHNSIHLVYPGIFRERAREQITLDLARTAASLDPIDSRAQLALGWSYAMAKQYDQAELHLGLAYELNENDPWTLTSSATGFAFCGNTVRAREIAGQALALSPVPSRTHWGYHTVTRFLCGDYEACVEAANRAESIMLLFDGWKISALFHLGRREEAGAEARRFIELVRRQWIGSEPPTDEAILRWFLHLFPIRKEEDWERLRAGLAGLGREVAHLRHHAW